ncbi:M23 family metallopeptidase [Citrifermentans bremense]|uniref:M23 family metallopeptidase n=1 Tax=Citrifermentans bremense TaxID=60035 RepID=UPI000558A003|nr:M23 family metallopeptidase [Citrifermentans bremense]
MKALLQYIFALYPPCLVAAALVWLVRGKPRHRLEWALSTATCGSVVAFAFLTAPWALTSYYLRFASLVLFALAVAYSMRGTKFNDKARHWSRLCFSISLLALLLFLVLDVLAIAAFHQPGSALNLSFPLASGNYYVLQGGNSMITNPFHVLGGSRLAFDVVKLNGFGNRADGIAPRSLAAYEIFGERISSPCAGTILFAQDGLPDNAPGRPDVEHPAGNHLVMKCADTELFMAHLKRGTIKVKAGQVVSAGELLGKVGNSGNTLEPHLHISAKMGGAERWLTFENRKLSVNSVVIE